MEERLVVKNFGPIKDMDIRIGKLTVLIGEQATGKSTLGKLLAVCRYFSYVVNFDYFEKEGTSFDYGLSVWGLSELVKKDSIIEYYSKHYSLKAISYKPSYDPWIEDKFNDMYGMESTITNKSEKFTNLINELHALNMFNTNVREYSLQLTPTTFFLNKVSNVMDNPFYLPAERGLQSLFSLGKSSLQNLDDALFDQFSKIDKISREFTRDIDVTPLEVKYKNEGGNGFFKKNSDDKYIRMNNAASGYQSTVPIVLLLEYYTQIRKKKKTFIIEEPELNLFPETQHKLMQYLVSNLNKTENQILITTHSPYVLSSLNDLILAAQTAKEKPEETNAVIDRKYWLDSESVSAYKLLPDGTCQNIIDEETGLIQAHEVDEVSNRINDIYDQLCEIKYAE